MIYQKNSPKTRVSKRGQSYNVIYIIRSGHLVKIGFTGYLEERLKTFRIGSPLPCDVIASFHFTRGITRIESLIHRVLTKHGAHQHGEWFLLSQEQIDGLCSILASSDGEHRRLLNDIETLFVNEPAKG